MRSKELFIMKHQVNANGNFYIWRRQVNDRDQKRVNDLLEQARAERSCALACELRIEAAHQREEAAYAQRQCSSGILTEITKIGIKSAVNIAALGLLGQTIT